MFQDHFSYQEVVIEVSGKINFKNVRFKRDYGPWREDDFVQTLVFDFTNSILSEMLGRKCLRNHHVNIL